MSEGGSPETESKRERLAAAFDASTDPLAKHASTFDSLPVDPFTVFLEETLPKQDPAPRTVRAYHHLVEQWQAFMAGTGRHPACPADHHVEAFIKYCRETLDNRWATINTKLRRLRYIIQSWQSDPVFPHREGYNPFNQILETTDCSREPAKEPPRLSIETLRSILAEVMHLRDQLIIAMQLKLGLRASELANLRIGDLHIDAPLVDRAYPEFGSNHTLTERPNAVYVASRYERAQNKSHRPRVLPIDDELQALLRAYLLARPDAATDRLLLTKSTHNPVDSEYINETWTDVFHPTYAETDDYSAVTSHFGRHRFTTHWRVHEDVPRPLVQYMRGDSSIADSLSSADAIDTYVHTYYADIEELYRKRMFKLGIAPAAMQ